LPLVLLDEEGKAPANTTCPSGKTANFTVQGSGRCGGAGVKVKAAPGFIRPEVLKLVKEMSDWAATRANILNENFQPPTCEMSCSA
jgi:hypothetical protein